MKEIDCLEAFNSIHSRPRVPTSCQRGEPAMLIDGSFGTTSSRDHTALLRDDILSSLRFVVVFVFFFANPPNLAVTNNTYLINLLFNFCFYLLFSIFYKEKSKEKKHDFLTIKF